MASSLSNSESSRPSLSIATAPALAWGRFVFQYRDYLAPTALLLSVVATRPHAFLGSFVWDAGLDAAGVLTALSGQALRVLVIGLAYIKRGGRDKRITANHLVCDGVFAHSRNPLYVGNFLILTGLAMVWNSPWVYLIVLPGFGFALFAMVLAEETYLSQRFGAEYEVYRARVNRFAPDFRGFRQTVSAFSFDWKRVVRKEYGTTFAWLSVALALIALERVRWHGLSGAGAELGGIAVVWTAFFALYGLARWLKKTRRLDLLN